MLVYYVVEGNVTFKKAKISICDLKIIQSELPKNACAFLKFPGMVWLFSVTGEVA